MARSRPESWDRIEEVGQTSSSQLTGADSSRARVVIEGVSPQLVGGRYPVKRILDDRFQVEADVYADGHDAMAARVCFRAPGKDEWRFVPLTLDAPTDRWSAAFTLDRIGRWAYTIEAWKDEFGTWRRDLNKFLQAGQNVEVDLLEGGLLVQGAAELAQASARQRLLELAGVLQDAKAPLGTRVVAALSQELQDLMKSHVDAANVTRFPLTLEVNVDRPRALFGAWYEMFPRSQGTVPGRHGTFADAERRLPQLAALGYDVVYLPPIHPIGRTHRKGRNNALVAAADDPGSPWAIGNEQGGHTAVEPQLGTLEDFDRFVASAQAMGLEVALDFALQCSPDHPWVKEHPDWFFVRPDGSIRYAENPPKRYEDIYPLNFWCDGHEALWQACLDVLLFWIDRGVRIFRVDNPHTKPLALWEWLIRSVQRKHPEVLFLAEAFTTPKRMQGLAKLGFTQSYSYFTWRNSASELRSYLTELTRSEMAQYFRPNFFANTPDILPEFLQTGGRAAFRIRLLLAATLSPVYGLYSGFEFCEAQPMRTGSEEYLDSEKYQILVRDWNAPGNLNEEIRALNRIRRERPALQSLTNLSFLVSENDAILAYRKSSPEDELIMAVNLDPRNIQESMVHAPLQELGLSPDRPIPVEDLLTGARYTWLGVRNYIRLDPALQVGHILRIHR